MSDDFGYSHASTLQQVAPTSRHQVTFGTVISVMARPKPQIEVAERLRASREKIFDTAQAAAEALGINPTTLRTHEAGTRGVNLSDLQRYARRYGVAFEWLVTGKGNQEPDILSQIGLGADWVPLEGTIQDDAWIPGDLDGDGFPGWGTIKTPAGLVQTAVYDDPRYPANMVSAFRVKTERTDGPYIDGSIVFVVEHVDFGLQDGDHAFILRHRRGFVEWTLREFKTNGGHKRLLSAGPDGFDAQDEVWIVGVVIGALTRRPARPLSGEARRVNEVMHRLWKRNAT